MAICEVLNQKDCLSTFILLYPSRLPKAKIIITSLNHQQNQQLQYSQVGQNPLNMSKNRYETLDVNLNLSNLSSPKKPTQRFSNTIDFDVSNVSVLESSAGENNDRQLIGQKYRVNKFRDLYYKNQKLRKQLKLLNVKLNQKLQKVKLVPIKHRKAQSVDLNFNKPSKALQRELQNAYKQIQMYKRRVATLKVKEQSQSTYDKFKTLDNSLSFKDMQIAETQAELKSIKNIKKIQERTMVDDLQNEDLKQKLEQYRVESKESQAKLKDVSRKARKREQQYKKQQAYQISLEKKLRQGIVEEAEQEQQFQAQQKKQSKPQEREVSQQQFKQVKAEIGHFKAANQVLQKKLDLGKKNIRDLKKERTINQEKIKQTQGGIGALNLKIQSYRRLINDIQKKKAVVQNAKNDKKYNTNFNSINQMDESKYDKSSKLRANNLDINLESDDPLDEDDSGNDSIDNEIVKPFQMSAMASSIHPSRQEERGWNGKPRKVTFGFMDSNDSIHKVSGNLKGLKAWIDEAHYICGLGFIYQDSADSTVKESGVVGTKADVQLKWELQSGDCIGKIECSFTEQGYMSQMLISTVNGLSAKFGLEASVDKNLLIIDKKEEISGFSCGVRKLGKDTRITELCFWLVQKGGNSSGIRK